MSDDPGTTPPTRPAGNRGRGRKPRLLTEPGLIEEITQAMRNGTPLRHALAAAGVSEPLGHEWIAKGTDDPGEPATADSPGRPAYVARSPYREFAEAVRRAKPVAIRNYTSTVAKAARGPTITTVIRHPDGRVETRTEQQPGDWRPAAWMLTRLDPDHFAEKRILAHAGPSGSGPVLIGGHAETVAALRGMTPEQLRALTGTDASDLAPLAEDPEGGAE